MLPFHILFPANRDPKRPPPPSDWGDVAISLVGLLVIAFVIFLLLFAS